MTSITYLRHNFISDGKVCHSNGAGRRAARQAMGELCRFVFASVQTALNCLVQTQHRHCTLSICQDDRNTQLSQTDLIDCRTKFNPWVRLQYNAPHDRELVSLLEFCQRQRFVFVLVCRDPSPPSVCPTLSLFPVLNSWPGSHKFSNPQPSYASSTLHSLSLGLWRDGLAGVATKWSL